MKAFATVARAASFETSSSRAFALRAVAVCAVAVLTAVAAQVRIPLPFSPVPITLQTLVVILAGMTLGARSGALSQVLYVALGVIGLPMFAGGAGALAGPTGGYIVGFILAAAIAGAMARRRDDTMGLALAFAAGMIAIYTCGTLWLSALTHQPLATALALGVLPFLAGDALKLVAAVGMARLYRPIWNCLKTKD